MASHTLEGLLLILLGLVAVFAVPIFRRRAEREGRSPYLPTLTLLLFGLLIMSYGLEILICRK